MTVRIYFFTWMYKLLYMIAIYISMILNCSMLSVVNDIGGLDFCHWDWTLSGNLHEQKNWYKRFCSISHATLFRKDMCFSEVTSLGFRSLHSAAISKIFQIGSRREVKSFVTLVLGRSSPAASGFLLYSSALYHPRYSDIRLIYIKKWSKWYPFHTRYGLFNTQ